MSTVSRIGRHFKAAPYTVLFGIVIGVLLAPGGGMDWAWSAYDRSRPVVSMTGKIVARDDVSVTVAIAGTKDRDCQFLTMRAYAVNGATLVDINTERADMATSSHTRPVGAYSVGNWRAWPVGSATSVQWWVSHSCDGRLLTTKVAEVSL